MSNVAVIGSQWGDEGKGKIVDWLSEKADVIVRFQGGHNAGHTLIVDNITYKLNLLPSGVVRKNKISIIGNGVVIDPWALLNEIKEIDKLGVKINNENLYIAENATLILPLHKELDEIREDSKNTDKIGTTRKGIGPAYEDKIGRRGIRVMDLANEKNLSRKIDTMLFHHNSIRKGLGKKTVNKDQLMKELLKISSEILKYSRPIWKKLEEFKKEKKTILFEGAQGVLLDVDHGTYPFVTSSNTTAGAISSGCGVGPLDLDYILGITKAYTTRVGEGPFPTELLDETGKYLADKGQEFGSTTGRPRRCGWFDGYALKRVSQLNSLSAICLTKMDVLDGLDEISPYAKTNITQLKNGKISEITIDPIELKIEAESFDKLLGNDAKFNANKIIDIFNGEDNDFSKAVCLNAAAGLIVAEKYSTFNNAYEDARKHILTGKAFEHLKKIQNV